ncbi:hypothetical protein BKA70DRAFT_1283068 [Coprinopsis sp. MPI-PUGE-AT-0042]|nr:hypothetical protein BKA70DRAFT_1283068 [Coprinopsis sp. MPI-PUGE-AT-0042]
MTTSHTSQSTIATANAPSPPHPSGIDRQQSHSSFATPHHADTGHNALAGPSTALAPPIYLQAHGVTTNQGDFALAGRDVHLHKHYHWRLATEIDTHITNIQSGDEATTTHLLRPHLEHHLLSALHPNQQTIQDHQPTLIDDSRGLHARLEEEGHVHSAEFSA